MSVAARGTEWRFDKAKDRLGSVYLSANLCGSLRLCGKYVLRLIYRRGAEIRRDSQRMPTVD